MMDIFVARQPIFDRKLNVFAYELLYRDNQNNQVEIFNGDKATSVVATNSLLVIGLDAITQGRKACINFTQRLIEDEIPTIFSNQILVVEILETVEPTEELITACKNLKKQGYMLAIDDFAIENIEKFKPLLTLVDIIKVDFMLSSLEDARKIIDSLSNGKIAFLAEKVETKEVFESAKQMGYTYFQGFFFQKPVIITGKDFESYKFNYVEALTEISKLNPDFDTLAGIIERDVSLSYHLLRLINSAAFYTVQNISSIKHALVLLGVKELRKWVALVMLRDIGKGALNEVTKLSLIRGRFAELIASKTPLYSRKTEVFLMGIFSLIDVMTNRPLDDLLDNLPLAKDVKEAMLGQSNLFRQIYEIVISYEKGNWETFTKCMDELGVDENIIVNLYIEALTWTKQVFNHY